MPTQRRLNKKGSRGKIGLQLIAKKAPVTTDLQHQIILVEWDGIGEQFFTGAVFHSHMNNLKLHVFINRAEKDHNKIHQLREAYGDHIVVHVSLTESKEGPWTDLLAYLINFHTKTLMTCLHCAGAHPKPRFHITVVAGKQDRYTELKALLKSEKTETKLVDGVKTTIMNLFQHVCYDCKIIFPDRASAEKHDRVAHNFLCRNKECQYSKRENGFFNFHELTLHEEGQMKCEYCKNRYFCDTEIYERHMNKQHVWCTCSCDKYYRNKSEFLEHYCRSSPLPCLESPDCETRFKDLDEMAFHHKTVHGSAHPYYCLACYSRSKLVYVRTAEELMAHVSEVNHDLNDFELVIIPNEDLISNPGTDPRNKTVDVY